MTDTEEIGVVVIGLGIAGNARVRHLQEKKCSFTLRGVVSRRPVTLPDVQGLSMDEALSREDVQAIMISTENKLHEEYVQQGLEHGKHVCVDYPIALSSSKAKELYELAEQKGLILQEELITLMTPTHEYLKAKAEKVGIKSVNSSTSAGFNGWIENFEKSGNPFKSMISGLHSLVNLFGDLEVVSGKLEKGEDMFTASACLKTKSGMPINLSKTRTKSKEGRKPSSVTYEFEDGETIDPSKLQLPPPSPPRPRLFMQDILKFLRAIVEGKNDKVAHERSVKCLQIAEKIESFF